MESTKSQVPAEEGDSSQPLNATNSRTQSRKVVLAMVLTLCFGLLLATVYLGGRISSAHANTAKREGKPSPMAGPRPQAKPAPVVATPAPLSAPTPEAAPPIPGPTQMIAKVAPPVVTSSKPLPAPVEHVKAVSVVLPKPAKVQSPVFAEPQPSASGVPADLVRPKPGDAYLQVGAFVSPYAERWVSSLEQRGFHPIVAEGPNSAVHRVLLGPLGPEEVSAVEAKLRQSGIDHFEKIY